MEMLVQRKTLLATCTILILMYKYKVKVHKYKYYACNIETGLQ